jgi:hypothetical protein
MKSSILQDNLNIYQHVIEQFLPTLILGSRIAFKLHGLRDAYREYFKKLSFSTTVNHLITNVSLTLMHQQLHQQQKWEEKLGLHPARVPVFSPMPFPILDLSILQDESPICF